MTRRERGFGALMEPFDDAPRPNGSRLSCGRNAGGSKVVEQQTKRPGQRGSAILPYLRAPGSFKRMLGCGISAAPPT